MTDAKPNPYCTYCGGEGTDRSTKLGESRIVSCDFCHHEGDFDPAVGAKFDEGKLRYDLIPPEALAEWVRVLTYGAEKYSDRNWENGIDTGRLFAAMQRHAWAWHGGEELDPEMQIHHMAAVMFNAAAIVTYYHRDRIDQAFGPTMEQVFDDVVRRGAGVTVTRVDPDEAFGPEVTMFTADESAPFTEAAFKDDNVEMPQEFIRPNVGNLTHEQKQMQGGDEQGASNDSAYRQAKAERPRRDPDPE